MEKDLEPVRMRRREAYFLIKRFYHGCPAKVLCDWTGMPVVYVT